MIKSKKEIVWEFIKEGVRNRFLLFFILLFILLVINYYCTESLVPAPETKNLWFYSGIFMIIFSFLFIEPYYTSPKNVITNAVPLLLVYSSIENSFENKFVWWATVIVLGVLLISSIIAMSLEDKDQSSDQWKNKISEKLKNVVVVVGQGKVLYSIVFFYFLITYYSIQNNYTITLFLFWALVLLINPKTISNKFNVKGNKTNSNEIGEIFGIQSKKIFLVKLFEDRKKIKKFDIAHLRYSMQDSNDLALTGIVMDTYLLNKEKWAKILQLGEPTKLETQLKKNIVSLVTDKNEKEELNKELKLDRFVGVIIDGSGIGKIKFEYSKKTDNLQEGDLLELNVGDKRLFYQVVSGLTVKEKLEERNETGFIEGEAIQLGEWENETLSFKKFGWVPSINTPVFIADTSDIEIKDYKYPEFKLGTIPNTTLPSVINLNDAVSHHLALLGVTGAGKSFLAREIISELSSNTKCICVDFTGEWKTLLSSLEPVDLIDSSKLGELEEKIAEKENESSGRYPDKSKLLGLKRAINEKLYEHVKSFIEAEKNISIFELPELSNTMFVLEFTQLFLDSVFSYAKKNKGQRICIVLEEAHTIIPETNFLGDLGDYGSSKALVSKMSQIALQGRKYGVGMVVIAQRTANVSKTVLTQCNTVICFQAFDETSFNFLGNYIGKDLVQALPNLKQYHAVATGKAIKSNLPMIIDLKRET